MNSCCLRNAWPQPVFHPHKHACNSLGIVHYPEMHLDMVRAGIILYGPIPVSAGAAAKTRSFLKTRLVP